MFYFPHDALNVRISVSRIESASSPCRNFRFKQPVRCVLPRYLDKPVTGGRHPMLAKYRVGTSFILYFYDMFSGSHQSTLYTVLFCISVICFLALIKVK